MNEQVIVSDVALARRIESAEATNTSHFVDTRALHFPEIGAQWMEINGCRAMFDGVGSPLTRTFGLGLFHDAAASDLSALEMFFRRQGADTNHFVSPLADISLFTLLLDRGYRPVEFSNVLFQPIGPTMNFAPLRRNQFDVRLAEDHEQELWAQTAAKGWSGAGYGDVLDISRMNAKSPGAVLFLAELGTEPVATGRLFLSEGVALLVGASTIATARNQGAQTALLQDRLRYAAQHGCDLAVMAALPGGISQRNAERQGFRIAYTRIKWRLPTSNT